MSREDKLKQLAEKKASKEMVIITNGEPFVEALGKKVDSLKNVLGNGVEINNLDELVDQLEKVEAFKNIVEELKKSIASLNFPSVVQIKGLEDLVSHTKKLSDRKETHTVIQKIDISVLDQVVEGVGNLIDKVEELQVPTQGQKPEDYVPMRRVLLVGKRLLFDDSYYNRGGGGGGSAAPPSMYFQPISQGGAGTTNLVGGVAGKRVKVTNYVVVMGGAGTLKFQSASSDITGTMSFGANGGVSVGGTEFSPAFQTGVGEALNMVTTSAAGNGHISYFLE